MMKCDKCKYDLTEGWSHCPNCGDSIKRQHKKRALRSPLGFWRVRTEGDVEGRTNIDLGTHEGYIDEIALRLAGQAMYKLTFSPSEKVSDREPSEAAHIQLDIASGTWDMTAEKRVEFFGEFFKDRPVTVERSNYYGSVLIRRT